MKQFLVVYLLVFCESLNAQWNTDLNLTNNSGSSSLHMNGGRSLMVDGNNVHIVYMDATTGSLQIYYKKSSNNGSSWFSPINLSNSLNSCSNPSVYYAGNKVWVLWTEYSGGNFDLMYTVSDDYGDTWAPSTSMSPTNGANNISFCVNGNYLFATWAATGQVNMAYLFGTIWGGFTTLFTGSIIGNPAIAGNGSDIVIVVTTEFSSGQSNIVYRRSIDYGASFSAKTTLPGQNNYGSTPDISIEGSHVHVTWCDNSTGVSQIYYQHSGDLGLTWGNPVLISVGSSNCYFPSISADGNNVVITWERDLSGNTEIYYANSSTAGITWNIQQRLTNANQSSERSCLDISSNGTTHVIWVDYRDFNYEVYYNQASSLPASGGLGIEDQFASQYVLVNPVNSGDLIEIKGLNSTIQNVKLFSLTGEELDTDFSFVSESLIVQPKQALSSGSYLLQIDSDVLRLIVN